VTVDGEAARRRGAAERGGALSVDAVQAGLSAHGYVAERELAVAVFLALELGKPLFVEGEAGVGKTEIAKVLARWLGRRLIRLQCYEGIDASAALYEWNHARQLLHVRLLEARGTAERAQLADLFAPEFLLRRPLLEALDPGTGAAPPVLLLDELDRADEEFEAFLLELLAEFQVTIPEFGTIRAERPPLVVVTSNRTREVHEALKRRCLYHWIEYPTFEKELAIARAQVAQAGDSLARQAVALVQRLRRLELRKHPGIAETLDWLRALLALGPAELSEECVGATLGSLLKYREDLESVRALGLSALLADAQRDAVSSGAGG
jgi:MoxR-like ATPase